MVKILDGKILRDHIGQELKTKIAVLKTHPTLAIIQIGSLVESATYIRQKNLFAQKIGVEVRHISFPDTITEIEVETEIKKLNSDSEVHGIILQLPLPAHLRKEVLLETIDSNKDVDGLHSVNLKKLLEGDPEKALFLPATAKGVVRLLKENNISLEGKHVVVIGRSLLVGQSIALLLLNENASVTILHKKSKNIPLISKQADIIISAAGKANLVTKEFVSSGQVIIDVGINSLNGKIVGDVDFEEVSEIVQAISPVPGGVGPMTIASLFENLLYAYLLQN